MVETRSTKHAGAGRRHDEDDSSTTGSNAGGSSAVIKKRQQRSRGRGGSGVDGGRSRSASKEPGNTSEDGYEYDDDEVTTSSAPDSHTTAFSETEQNDEESTSRSEKVLRPRNHENRGATNKKREAGSERIPSRLPLPDVVKSRAFECVVSARGVVSKVLDLTKEHGAKLERYHRSETIRKARRSEADGVPHRHSHHGRFSSSAYRLESLRRGEDVNIGLQVGIPLLSGRK